MQITTDGLVLKSTDYKENDKLLTILTKESGVVFALARGAKRLSSPLSAATNQFAYANFVLFSNNDRYTVDSADSINLFFGLNNDIEKLSLASYFCELVSVFAPENIASDDYLRLLLNALFVTEKSRRPVKQIKAVFELRILAISGFMPDIVACSSCGDYCKEKKVYFDLANGLITCFECSKNTGTANSVALSPAVLNAARHSIYSDDNKIYNFSLGEESLSDFSSFSEKYLLRCIDRKPKTLDFLNSVII